MPPTDEEIKEAIMRTAPKTEPATPEKIEEDQHALWQALHSGPGVTANRFGIYAYPYNGGVRLSFAEQYDEKSPIVFRAGVLLSEWTLFELWQILGRTEVVQRWQAAQPGGSAYVDPADVGDGSGQ